MQEKHKQSQPSGICHRLFNFLMNTLIARSLVKQVSLGRPAPQDQEPMIPAAKPNHRDQKSQESGSGFEIQVHYKQSDDDLESWTQIEHWEPVKKSPVSEQRGNLRKVLSIQDIVTELEAEKNRTEKKGKGIMIGSEHLTLAMAAEDDEKSTLDLKRVKLFNVAPNINEKSDEFIRSRKEAMRRSHSLEPRMSQSISN